jgi:bifunctional non-homologous end joining protein LigD
MKNNLKKYNNKRNFKNTNEPIGKIDKSKSKLKFVVQHHLATKDHFDFRLEYDGVLKSFAIPKGPSYDPRIKRLAIAVEDHPLSYRNYEGVIPDGEYGAGPVQVWDKGYWIPLNNPNFEGEIVKLQLHGIRLKGIWNLVHLKNNEWLLIKDKDSFYVYKDIKKLNTSVKTGRTMTEILNNKKFEKASILITHPDKIMYSKDKITKIDIVNYYNDVYERMSPYLKNRLVSTIRLPNILKLPFFKKHPDHESKGIKPYFFDKKPKPFFYFTSKTGLISEIQMNSIEFHLWNSRINNINKPDMAVFDFDPDKSVSLEKLRQGVLDLKSILDKLSLNSFLKTSGGKGYHVVVPYHFNSWQDLREFSHNVAKLMESMWPDKYTSNIRLNNRHNKILIDWLRNALGATSCAPYSLRIRKYPTISMPIKWSDLSKIKPDEINIKNYKKYLKRKDPWYNFFDVNNFKK